MKLSDSQSKSLTSIIDALNLSEDIQSLAVLTGPAGSGKSTLVKYFAEEVGLQRRSIFFAATTHMAATVLQDTINDKTYTAHKLFGIRPKYDRYGNESLSSSGNVMVTPDAIVVIDEASMISDKFLHAIAPIVKQNRLKVVFVGDYYQLPPVKDRCSIFDGSLPTFHLSEIHRQAKDNPIIQKSQEYTAFIDNQGVEPVLETMLNDKGEGIHVIDHQQFMQKFTNEYINFKAGDTVTKPLCTYTNDSAINYNNVIRKASLILEKDSIQPYYIGEEYISNTSTLDSYRKVILENNERVFILSYCDYVFEDIPGYSIKVRGNNDKTKVIFVPKQKKDVTSALKELKKHAIKQRDWEKYYVVKNFMSDLRLPFAGTTHKAQGATYESVFIDIQNIYNKCRDLDMRARLIYVALTRAKTNVYLTK